MNLREVTDAKTEMRYWIARFIYTRGAHAVCEIILNGETYKVSQMHQKYCRELKGTSQYGTLPLNKFRALLSKEFAFVKFYPANNVLQYIRNGQALKPEYESDDDSDGQWSDEGDDHPTKT